MFISEINTIDIQLFIIKTRKYSNDEKNNIIIRSTSVCSKQHITKQESNYETQ